ncbi:MAG TPA: Spy/CpxP family protein refolding chaperone [Usitatibacter sp.]|jgi:hypothetical protein|nr:Spy/CpxP family protein refolding chaperone [Usitatibacter sp.]
MTARRVSIVKDISQEQSMQRFPCLAASLLALAAFASPAMAQVPGPTSDASPYASRAMPPNGPADPVAYAQQDLESLRSRLGIGPSQAQAWNAFVDAVLAQSRDMQATQSLMAQAPASAPDRLARMAEMMRRGADGMANVSRALRALYAQLDPGQRAIVDREFARGPGGMPPRG